MTRLDATIGSGSMRSQSEGLGSNKVSDISLAGLRLDGDDIRTNLTFADKASGQRLALIADFDLGLDANRFSMETSSTDASGTRSQMQLALTNVNNVALVGRANMRDAVATSAGSDLVLDMTRLDATIGSGSMRSQSEGLGSNKVSDISLAGLRLDGDDIRTNLTFADKTSGQRLALIADFDLGLDANRFSMETSSTDASGTRSQMQLALTNVNNVALVGRANMRDAVATSAGSDLVLDMTRLDATIGSGSMRSQSEGLGSNKVSDISLAGLRLDGDDYSDKLDLC